MDSVLDYDTAVTSVDSVLAGNSVDPEAQAINANMPAKVLSITANMLAICVVSRRERTSKTGSRPSIW